MTVSEILIWKVNVTAALSPYKTMRRIILDIIARHRWNDATSATASDIFFPRIESEPDRLQIIREK